jgi:hypothetical protein
VCAHGGPSRHDPESTNGDGELPPEVDLSRVWVAVAAELWHRTPRWHERLGGRLLGSPGLARALLTTPSLLVPWLIASVLVLARSRGDDDRR